MGYGGKVAERVRARELRARAWTLDEIADELGVSKSSVSVWVRDVEFSPKPRNRGHRSHKPQLRVRLYLHEGLDLDAAERYWSEVLAIPRDQFGKACRAVADASRRRA